jgi:hypothetical protein
MVEPYLFYILEYSFKPQAASKYRLKAERLKQKGKD